MTAHPLQFISRTCQSIDNNLAPYQRRYLRFLIVANVVAVGVSILFSNFIEVCQERHASSTPCSPISYRVLYGGEAASHLCLFYSFLVLGKLALSQRTENQAVSQQADSLVRPRGRIE